MKRLLFIFVLLLSIPSLGATVNVNAGMTATQIQAAINGSANGDTIAFAGGTYSLPSGPNSNGASLNLLAGRIYTGPTSGTAAHMVGSGVYPLMYFSGTTVTVQYLTFDHGGLFLENFVTSASILHNLFQNIDCGVNASQTVGIFVAGGLNNSDISFNTFSNLGQTCNNQFQNSQGAGGIQLYGFHNLTITNNVFDLVYEGIAIVISNSAQFDGVGGKILNNTFTRIHRMAIEELGTTTNPSGLEVAYTNYSNAYLPWAYTFGLSLTAGQNMIVHDNIMNGNVNQPGYVPYGVEIGGVNSSAYNNTIEGYWGWGFAIGTNVPINISNNRICGPTMAVAPTSGSVPVQGNANGFISWEGSSAGGTFTGNVTSSALTCETPPAPACHAVSVSGAGSKNGSNWSNAMQGLPSTLVRGDTYYMADGNYPAYSFTTANSGTTRITVKKAQAYDYGRTTDGCSGDISAGWNAGSMGSAQAVWPEIFGGNTSGNQQGYITWDGNGQSTGVGCGTAPSQSSAPISDCGLRVSINVIGQDSGFDIGANNNDGLHRSSSWSFRYFEIQGGGDANNGSQSEEEIRCRGGCDNFVIDHSFLHLSGCDFFKVPWTTSFVVQNTYINQNMSSATCHGQLWYTEVNASGVDFHSNIIQDIQGTGMWVCLTGCQASNWSMYNNVIWRPSGDSRPGVANGLISCVNTGSTCTNFSFIQNSVINYASDYSGHMGISCDAGPVTATWKNNLFYITTPNDAIDFQLCGGSLTESNNTYLNTAPKSFTGGTGDIVTASGASTPFINWQILNFALSSSAANVSNGAVLSSPFNVDAIGAARPTAGVWNRGWLQFTNPPPLSSCTLVKDEPQYGYNTLPGSQRSLIVYETGCPSAPISNVVMNGTTTAATVTFTVPDASIFTVGKTVTTTGFVDYPFNQFFQGGAFTITATGGTSVTATYNNAFAVASSTAVSGATLIQSSKINWTTTAGTLSCASNCLPTTNLTTDATAGNLTTVEPNTPYPSGGYTMTSTHQILVTASPVDNPSNSVTYTINQASKTTQVVVTGAQYTQAYSGQNRQLWSSVQGNVNQNVTWSITQPGGGNGTLSNTTKRNTIFRAVAAGRYKVTATSVDDPTKSAYQIIDVTATATPSYAAAPPDKAGPQACYAAPGLTGTVYEVGPTQAFHNLNDVPWRTMTQGSIVRVHNEDTTGMSPTTYHEYLQLPIVFTADQPLQICGVPDATGKLPVIDGDHAHGPTWWSNPFLYGAGVFTLNPTTSCVVSNDPSGSCGPTHIRIAGLKIIHANPSYSFYQADGVTLSPWGGDAIDVRTGAYITVEGTAFDTTSQGVGTYANQNGNFPAISQAVLWSEAYTVNNGVTNNATAHPAYLQSINGNVMDRVYVDTPITGDQGSCIKARGQSNIFANVYCGNGFSRGIDFVEAQDDSIYIDFTQAMIQGGVYNLGGFNLNLEASRQESNFKDYVFGSVLKSNNHHYLMDHDDQLGNVGMNGRYGRLYFWYNTSVDPGVLIDTGNQYNLNYFLNQNIAVANNILWQSTGSWGINDFSPTAFTMQTNVMNSASMNNTTPIWGTPQVFGASGWLGKTQENAYAMNRPLETHITGNLVSDFIKTSTTPYNTTTYAPGSGSAALGAAGAITGDMATFELTYNAMITPGVYSRRMTPSTIGAIDGTSAPPTLVSISVTFPNGSPATTLNLLYPTTQQLKATCTFSDTSTTDCTSSATWDNGGSPSFTAGAGLISSLNHAGSGTVRATSASIISNSVVVNVALPTPPVVKFGAGAKIGVGSGSGVKIF